MPLQPANIAAIASKMKWRVIIADLFCIAALVVSLFSLDNTDLWHVTLVLLGIGLVSAVLAVVER